MSSSVSLQVKRSHIVHSAGGEHPPMSFVCDYGKEADYRAALDREVKMMQVAVKLLTEIVVTGETGR